MMMLMPTETSRQPQYGLESIEGFCEGWGELDQLSDISTQILNAKYPSMGSLRVSVDKIDHNLSISPIILQYLSSI